MKFDLVMKQFKMNIVFLSEIDVIKQNNSWFAIYIFFLNITLVCETLYGDKYYQTLHLDASWVMCYLI